MKFLQALNNATAEQQDRWFGYVFAVIWVVIAVGFFSMLATGGRV